MAFTSNLDPRAWTAWELDPNTRQSVHLLTKWYPIDTTLATAGTAENLISVAPGIPTVNLVTNPSAETADPPTGYTASGSAISRSNTYSKYDTYSVLVNPDNAAAGEGFYWDLGVLPGNVSEPVPLSVSCYFRDAAGSTNGVRVRLYGVTTADYTNGTTVALATDWTRSTLTTRLTVSQQYYLYVATVLQHNTSFYADGLQAEILPQVTDYCDGAQGLYNWWDGTAHASTSRRWKKLSNIRNYTLHTDRDIYIAFDHTASSTTGRFVKAGSDFWLDFPVYIRSNISFINAIAGETPRVTGDVWGI